MRSRYRGGCTHCPSRGAQCSRQAPTHTGNDAGISRTLAPPLARDSGPGPHFAFQKKVRNIAARNAAQPRGAEYVSRNARHHPTHPTRALRWPPARRTRALLRAALASLLSVHTHTRVQVSEAAQAKRAQWQHCKQGSAPTCAEAIERSHAKKKQSGFCTKFPIRVQSP